MSKKLVKVFIYASTIVFITILSLMGYLWSYKSSYEQLKNELFKKGIATTVEQYQKLYPSNPINDKNIDEFCALIKDDGIDIDYHEDLKCDEVMFTPLISYYKAKIAANRQYLTKLQKFCQRVDSIKGLHIGQKIAGVKSYSSLYLIPDILKINFDVAMAQKNRDEAFKILLCMKKLGDYSLNFICFFPRMARDYHSHLERYLSNFKMTPQELKLLTKNFSAENDLNLKLLKNTISYNYLYLLTYEDSMSKKYEFHEYYFQSGNRCKVSTPFSKTMGVFCSLAHEKIMTDVSLETLKNIKDIETNLKTNKLPLLRLRYYAPKKGFYNKALSNCKIYFGHEPIILRRRMAVVALAIEKFKLKNNRRPKKLIELIPKYLTNEQIHSFTGTPFGYEPNIVEVETYTSVDNTACTITATNEIKKYFAEKLTYSTKNPTGIKDKQKLEIAIKAKLKDVFENGKINSEVKEIINNNNKLRYERKKRKVAGYRIYSNDFKKSTPTEFIVIDNFNIFDEM
ncbi:hypothetical protein AAEX28_09035 [Lentisphaerota bacterium WC36G]|nr:hypothetical protein LJT99_11885 [Lentisphaerae bacterium WC36]